MFKIKEQKRDELTEIYIMEPVNGDVCLVAEKGNVAQSIITLKKDGTLYRHAITQTKANILGIKINTVPVGEILLSETLNSQKED